jgi:hypothetical protein
LFSLRDSRDGSELTKLCSCMPLSTDAICFTCYNQITSGSKEDDDVRG